MAETIDNVIVGKGNLYIAEVDTALPTITGTLGGTITWTNWSTPGFLAKDIELKFSEEVQDFTPRGYLTAVKTAIKSKGASGKFVIAEADVDALALALSNSDLDTGVLSDGGDEADVVYKAIAIETALAVYHFKNVHIKADTSIKLSDGEFVEIPVEFTAYALSTATAGERVYQIHERTAAAG